MTRRTNARIAGVAYLLYIAAAFPSMVLSARATAGDGWAAKLATMVAHAADVRLAAVLTLTGCFCALVLAVTLYAITRDQDRDLAMFALTCRVAEGIVGAAWIAATLAVLGTATLTGGEAVAAFVLQQNEVIAATFFAVGSTVFSWLLLRGKMVPTWLAWLGIIGSAVVAVAMPLRTLQVLSGSAAQLTWVPVGVFEVVLAVWLIVKGVGGPEGVPNA